MKHHGAGLRKLTKNENLVEQLTADFRNAEISEAERTMLEYAAKLTSEPWTVTEADIINLRNNGFTDEAVLDINQVTGYYAFVNRLADGLGVELESFWTD